MPLPGLSSILPCRWTLGVSVQPSSSSELPQIHSAQVVSAARKGPPSPAAQGLCLGGWQLSWALRPHPAEEERPQEVLTSQDACGPCGRSSRCWPGSRCVSPGERKQSEAVGHRAGPEPSRAASRFGAPAPRSGRQVLGSLACDSPHSRRARSPGLLPKSNPVS